MKPSDAPIAIRDERRTIAPGDSLAFSLVEMLLVLVVISALLATMAVSLAGRRDHQALRVAAEDLATSLRFAAERARLTGRPCRLAFQDDYSGYRLEIATDQSGESFAPDIGMAGQGRRFAEGIRLVQDADPGRQARPAPKALTFAPQGKGFAGRLHLRNRADEQIDIEVIPETHQVHVLP